MSKDNMYIIAKSNSARLSIHQCMWSPQNTNPFLFATYCLMPSKQLRRVFKAQLKVEKYHISEDTEFNLNYGSVEELKAMSKALHSLAYTLAAAKYYGGLNVISMAQRFKVSNEAMAIRLEELELLEL